MKSSQILFPPVVSDLDDKFSCNASEIKRSVVSKQSCKIDSRFESMRFPLPTVEGPTISLDLPTDPGRSGKVYFVRAIGKDKGRGISIGFTSQEDPMIRVRQWSTRANIEVELLATLSGYEWDEKNIHRMFNDERQGRSEWFNESLKLLYFIMGLCYSSQRF